MRQFPILLKSIHILTIFYFLMFSSCVPDTSIKKTDISYTIDDAEVRNIFDLQDQQKINELYPYLKSDNPSLRYLAAMAFASIKNPVANDSLFTILKDPIEEVRSAAAYAIGQNGDNKAVFRLIAAFRNKDTLDVNSYFNSTILESIGKIGDKKELKNISTVTSYRDNDTLLLLGQSRSIFQFALRNLVLPEGTNRMVQLLDNTKIPSNVRLIAAHYLARAKELDLSPYTSRIVSAYNQEKDDNIKMTIATAMGKNIDTTFVPALISSYNNSLDYRVKINIIKALAKYPYLVRKELLFSAIKDENIHVAATAAEVLQNNGFVEDVPSYALLDTITTPWQVRAYMNGAVLANASLYFTKYKNAFSERIVTNLNSAKSPYEKAAYMLALSQDPYNYFLITNLYKQESSSIVKQAALEGLGNILKNPLFYKAFGNEYGKVKSIIQSTLLDALNSQDIGLISVASNIIMDPVTQYKAWFPNSEFLQNIQNDLKLPKDIETYNDLGKCIAYLKDTTFTPKKVVFNNPIDWSFLEGRSDSSVVAIKTSKGVLRVQLFPNISPGSVSNFLKLVGSKFYNGKIFHRVVPNFVVQIGCPRGDGYGGLDYTIRSELTQGYYDKEGYLGMASAGNHTESTQWFITHSPTPHLDGKYTLFGKVISGMDVVHSMQVGDVINEIIIVK